jgi:hypothetical protein
MNALNVGSLQSQTQTVSVYTRHTTSCSKRKDPHWKRCNCVKYIYLLRDGKNKTISAKTRSWAKAEDQAQEIRDSWNPLKQKLRELGELERSKQMAEVTITDALDRWIITVKSDSDSDNEQTYSKYQTASKQIKAWASRNQLLRLSQITPDALDKWKSAWKPKAKHPDDRIGKTTAGRRLEKVRGFLATA